ncbi:MAG: class I SAM-dependent methyltransferase [Myxococcales bacterium]|nr:class I SAM-dependent methyltransferase [Myxococcales bacterium]
MGLQQWIGSRLLDWAMRQMNDLRPESVSRAEGEVLEVGFGTGLNLEFYPPGVKSLTAVDPFVTDSLPAVDERIRRCTFPVERHRLRADQQLPFDSGRFDCVVTTWTLCSIPEPLVALAEMRRVLKSGGRYLFIEHGRASDARTARWQDRVNPVWRRLAAGCNMNRSIDTLVERGGFELTSLDRFQNEGSALLAAMYRGEARRSG